MTYKELKQKYGQDAINVVTKIQLQLTEMGFTGQYDKGFEKELLVLVAEGESSYGIDETYTKLKAVVERRFG